MQCVNCQFENMPGTPSCVRCGTSLNLANTVLVLEPPRAGRLQKRLRHWIPLRRLVYPVQRAWSAVHRGGGAFLDRWVRIDWPSPGALARAVVPGWSHAYLGDPERGRVFFFAWLALLFLTFLSFGSFTSALALGGAIAVQVATFVDLLFVRNRARLGTMLAVTALFAVLVIGGYWQLGRALSNWVDARQLLITGSPLQSGDVILLHPNAYRQRPAQVGDVVVYRAEFVGAIQGYLGDQRTLPARFRGEWVDRVIAPPESSVLVDKGQIWINNQPSPHLPLAPERMPEHLEFKVPADSYGIIPTTDPYIANNIVLVRAQNITGRAIVRNWPFWRFWWFR